MTFDKSKKLDQWHAVWFCSASTLVILFLLWSDYAAAAPDAGILNDINYGYRSAASGWTEPLLNIAERVFWILALIELAWSAAVWVLESDQFQSFFAALIKKVMFLGFFLLLIKYADTWIPAIIDSFVAIAQEASSQSRSLTPSGVFDLGLQNAAFLFDSVMQIGLWGIPLAIFVALASIAIVVAFAIVAAQLLLALIESYIVITAGLFFLGFGGSSWTSEYTRRYLDYAVATGVKLMMVYLIIGLGTSLSRVWRYQIEQIGDGDLNLAEINTIIMGMVGGSLVFAYLTYRIPNIAAGMMAGQPATSAADLKQTAVQGTMAVASGGKTAIMAASNTIRGGVRAGNAISKARKGSDE